MQGWIGPKVPRGWEDNMANSSTRLLIGAVTGLGMTGVSLSEAAAVETSAVSWSALNYAEAVWLCSTGNLQACEVMYALEMARSGAAGGRQVSGGSGRPADSTMPQDHTISASPDNGDFGPARNN